MLTKHLHTKSPAGITSRAIFVNITFFLFAIRHRLTWVPKTIQYYLEAEHRASRNSATRALGGSITQLIGDVYHPAVALMHLEQSCGKAIHHILASKLGELRGSLIIRATEVLIEHIALRISIRTYQATTIAYLH